MALRFEVIAFRVFPLLDHPVDGFGAEEKHVE